MTCRVIDCEQRTPAWYEARAGVITATAAAEMLANPRKGATESVQRRNLRVRLALELLTGKATDDGNGYRSVAMQRGCDLEREAFAAYEAETGDIVSRVGFLRHVSLPIGCSPDGIVGDFEGGLELKCPEQAAHWEYLQLITVPTEYQAQIRHSLLVSGLPWWDFVSYHPDFPPSGRLHRVRTLRASIQKDLDAHELAVELFWREVNKELDAMRDKLAAEVA
jgi:hypothetical protein